MAGKIILPADVEREVYRNEQHETSDPGPWYVVKSECNDLGLEIAQNVKPMFRAKTFQEAKAYLEKQFNFLANFGYFPINECKDNPFILKINDLLLRPMFLFNKPRYIVFGMFSQRQANAGHFVHWEE